MKKDIYPRRQSFLTPTSMKQVSREILVVYCGGPHCNGFDKATIKLAELNIAVKK